jgi:hypothetical protein
MLPSLGELFAIGIPIGALLGGIVGFAIRAPTSGHLVRNVVDGATVGGLGGTAICLAIWIGGAAAGG